MSCELQIIAYLYISPRYQKSYTSWLPIWEENTSIASGVEQPMKVRVSLSCKSFTLLLELDSNSMIYCLCCSYCKLLNLHSKFSSQAAGFYTSLCMFACKPIFRCLHAPKKPPKPTTAILALAWIDIHVNFVLRIQNSDIKTSTIKSCKSLQV